MVHSLDGRENCVLEYLIFTYVLQSLDTIMKLILKAKLIFFLLKIIYC